MFNKVIATAWSGEKKEKKRKEQIKKENRKVKQTNTFACLPSLAIFKIEQHTLEHFI